jgi:MoxR-like ATPase
MDDVLELAFPVLRHRLVPNFAAQAENRSADDLIARAIAELPRQRS